MDTAVCSRPVVLVGHPSADVYGADLQLIDTVAGLLDAGASVHVSVPKDGPLVERLVACGAQVRFDAVPVVRRSALSPGGVLGLGAGTAQAALRLARLIRHLEADLVLANTMTIPAWLAAARLARRPSVCHVHEAEDADSTVVLRALVAPLRLATGIIANSRAAQEAMTRADPGLRRGVRVVHNGIPNPPDSPTPAVRDPDVLTVAVVGRLSPRKAPDIALEAVARMRQSGRQVRLLLCGTTFDGYEWYETQLHTRAQEPDLAGAVDFVGYADPIWHTLERVDVVAAPSLREPFGNAVVEAQLARRPVVAAASLGHLETVEDGVTGLLVAAGDPGAMAEALTRLMDDPELAARLADTACEVARRRFSIERYRSEMAWLCLSLARSRAT